MAIQGTDVLLVNRAGTDYKTPTSTVMAKVQAGDWVLVNRGGVDYKLSGTNFLAGTFHDTDWFLINRAGVDYKVDGATMKTILSRAPAFGTAVLSEDDTKGAAFTSQAFTATITLADAGKPTATIGLKATVVGGGVTKYLVFNAAGAVSDMQSADPGFVTMTNTSNPKLTFPAAFPSGNAPDTELPNGTTITVVVEARNSAGAVTKTSNTLTPARETKPGDTVGGGYFIGKINDSGTIYNLILAPKAGGQLGNIKYESNYPLRDAPLSAHPTNGPGNTEAYFNDSWYQMHSWYKSAAGPNRGTYDKTNAAGTGIGGKNDWYFCASLELELFYYYLKPSTFPNRVDGTTGTNGSAVPPHGAYTTSVPAQVADPIFRTGGSECFDTAVQCGASDQTNRNYNKMIAFGNGYMSLDTDKTTNQTTRAVRREPA